jgi:hypothetical protein
MRNIIYIAVLIFNIIIVILQTMILSRMIKENKRRKELLK